MKVFRKQAKNQCEAGEQKNTMRRVWIMFSPPLLILYFFSFFYTSFFIFSFSLISFAHEPIFGVGARTIWKGGFGFEIGAEFEGKDGGVIEDGTRTVEIESIYGITPDISVRGIAEYDFNQFVVGASGRFRFLRYDGEGFQDSGSLNLSISQKAIGGGVSYAHESRRFYFFSFSSAKLGIRKPSSIKIDFGGAFGLRPVLTEYYLPDVVLFLEILYREGMPFGGFSLFATFRNYAIKGGWIKGFSSGSALIKISFDLHI